MLLQYFTVIETNKATKPKTQCPVTNKIIESVNIGAINIPTKINKPIQKLKTMMLFFNSN